MKVPDSSKYIPKNYYCAFELHVAEVDSLGIEIYRVNEAEMSETIDFEYNITSSANVTKSGSIEDYRIRRNADYSGRTAETYSRYVFKTYTTSTNASVRFHVLNNKRVDQSMFEIILYEDMNLASDKQMVVYAPSFLNFLIVLICCSSCLALGKKIAQSCCVNRVRIA